MQFFTTENDNLQPILATLLLCAICYVLVMKMTAQNTQKPAEQPVFHKVIENLYRLESSGGYYALIKKSGKQFRRSLKTKDRKLAERRLKELKRQIGCFGFTVCEATVLTSFLNRFFVRWRLLFPLADELLKLPFFSGFFKLHKIYYWSVAANKYS
jgi:hypothetical protein